MTDIFDEVGEDLRRDRLNRLWKNYGGVIIGLAVLVVLGTAVWRGWVYYSEQQAAAAGDLYSAAIAKASEGDANAAAESLLAFSSDAPKGYAVLARFRAASAKAAAGETDTAVAAFDALAKDAAVPQEMRDLAAIRAAMIAVDTEDLAAVKARLAAFDSDISPWRFSARELIALAAVKAQAWDDARAMLDKLKADPSAPQDVASRTGILAGVVRAAAGEPEKPAPAGS